MLSSLCLPLLCLAALAAALPAGLGSWEVGNTDSQRPFYSTHNFVDDYLRHSGYNTPSDSELGDLIWGLLYTDSDPRYTLSTLKRPWWQKGTKHQPWLGAPDADSEDNVGKRKQWLVPYGKRDGRDAAAKRSQMAWYMPAYGKRQQSWHVTYGKRQQSWHTPYGKRTRGSQNDQAFGKSQLLWP